MAQTNLHEKVSAVRRQLASVIRGKRETFDLLLTALFAGGHILMEDVPGVGKTTLAKALSLSVEAQFNRIQFTPDLLPADILGSSIFSPKEGSFFFRKGPIFTNFLLADEINRASPRTQSALLEAMNERQVSIDGHVEKLAEPFLVIATENPVEYYGTYPLPEAQLDRFALQISLGYPDEDAEMALLMDRKIVDPLDSIQPLLDCREVCNISAEVHTVEIERSIMEYMIQIIRATRDTPEIRLGASPRALLTLSRCAQAAAWLDGRVLVRPDDVKNLLIPVLAHRLVMTLESKHAGISATEILEGIIQKTKIPV